jgi:hypothetical protein
MIEGSLANELTLNGAEKGGQRALGVHVLYEQTS